MTAHTQLVLWIAHPVLQVAVAVTMFRQKLHRTFPVFFAYIAFQVFSFSFLFPLNTWGIMKPITGRTSTYTGPARRSILFWVS